MVRPRHCDHYSTSGLAHGVLPHKILFCCNCRLWGAQDITVTGVKPSGEPRMFQHPAIQSAFMFLGEFLCIIPFLLSFWFSRRDGKESGLAGAFHNETPAHMLKTLFSFAVPALCDAAATTLLNIGLFYTCVSFLCSVFK